MNDVRTQPLRDALKAVTDRVPRITRGVVNAGKSTKPIGWRQLELAESITQARALLDELMLHQVQLGWHSVASLDLDDWTRGFLSRFVKRGWLSADRPDASEQRAIEYGLRRGWLRRELSEAHFTPVGREALQGRIPSPCPECGSTTDKHASECGLSWSPDYAPAAARKAAP